MFLKLLSTKYQVIIFVLTSLVMANTACSRIPHSAPFTIAEDGHIQYATHDYSEPIIVDDNKVVFAYMANDDVFSSKAWSYDLDKDVATGPIDLGGSRADPHNYPNIVKDKEGYYHVFYGSHSTELYHRKSERPGDISSWAKLVKIKVKATYPRPFIRDNGNIVVFFRESGSDNTFYAYGYIESSDGGKTWSDHRPLINNTNEKVAYVGGVYLDGDDIHICWSWYHSSREVNKKWHYDELSYAKFSFTQNKAFEANGTSHNVPIQIKGVHPIVNEIKQYAEDVTLDSKSRPVVLYADYDGTDDDGMKVAWWDGKNWYIEEFDNKASMSSQRFAHSGNGSITICSDTEAGLKLYQKDGFKQQWKVRNLTELNGRHPVIKADLENNLYHIFWHKADVGHVQYLRSKGLDFDK